MKWVAALVLAGPLALVSCEREAVENKGSGEEVAIRIRLLEMAEGDEADAVRSGALGEVERVSMPVGDGLMLEMSLEREDLPLRAGVQKPLADNAYFRVIAIDEDKKYVCHGDLRKGETSHADLHVPENADYTIICFSYNSTDGNSLPSFTAARGDDMSGEAISVDMPNLLWCSQSLHVGNTAPAPLSILLKHPVAKVKVVIDCTYNEWNITDVEDGVTVGQVAIAQAVGLVNGAVSGSAVGAQAIDWPVLSVGDEQTSDSIVVVPKAGPFTVSIPKNAIVRASPLIPIPTTEGTYGLTGSFNTALDAGGSYRLRMKLRAPKWAGSNIYWDGGTQKLAFEPHGSVNDEGIQGVYFKWGSLIGIAPTDATVIYKPNGSGLWLADNYSDWSDIHAWDSSTYGNEIVSGHEDLFIGDICKAISNGDYRLPHPGEFGSHEMYWNDAGGWVYYDGTGYNTGDDAGRYNLIDNDYAYAQNMVMGNVRLPAAMFRGDIGDLYDVRDLGYYGAYWHDSPDSPGLGSCSMFLAYGFSANTSVPVNYGLSVRCVLDD